MNPTPTPSEWRLIRHLIQLWQASYDSGPCRHGCDCPRCQALEVAGSHEAATFDSLTDKAEQALKEASTFY